MVRDGDGAFGGKLQGGAERSRGSAVCVSGRAPGRCERCCSADEALVFRQFLG